jgi:hypothetical protein
MFPGASKLFFDQLPDANLSSPPALINDISQVKSELIDLSNDTNELNITDSNLFEGQDDLSEIRAMLTSPSA